MDYVEMRYFELSLTTENDIRSGGSAMDWVNFFEYLSAASAAVLGLAFVSFAAKPSFWSESGLRYSFAVVSLVELAVPLFFSLMYLPPGHHWRVAGYITGALGYSVMMLQVSVAVYYKNKGYKFSIGDRLQLSAGLLLIATTFSLVFWSSSLPVKAGTCIWLIFSGLTEAWISLHQPSLRLTTGAAHPSHEAGA